MQRACGLPHPPAAPLEVDITDTPGRGSAGIAAKPGSVGYWPAGLCLCFPKTGSANGQLVLAPGDVKSDL